MPEPAFLGLADAARFVGCGRSTFYKLIREGKIKAVKQGRRTLISVQSLRAYANRLALLEPAYLNDEAFLRIRTFSHPSVSGCFARDNERGCRLAEQLVAEAEYLSFPGMLGHIVRDMVDRHRFDDVHIGFFGRLMEIAMQCRIKSDEDHNA